MTGPATQSFAAGAPASARYGKLGGFDHRMACSPQGVIMAILGWAGSGKSKLAQDNPNAFIFNLDCSTTVTTTPKAVMWPGINPQGNVIDDNGQPFVLEYDAVLRKIAILCELAKANQPRPKMIVFDSLYSWGLLVQKWILANAKALGLLSYDRQKVDYWRELHGQSAYDTLFSHIVDTTLTLRSHGYGVMHCIHLQNTPLYDDKDRLVRKIKEVTASDGLWKRLKPLYEIVGFIYPTVEVSTQTVNETVSLGSGRSISRPRTISEEIPIRKLCFSDPDLIDVLKKRPGMDDSILLPKADAWQAFETAYLAAQS